MHLTSIVDRLTLAAVSSGTSDVAAPDACDDYVAVFSPTAVTTRRKRSVQVPIMGSSEWTTRHRPGGPRLR